MRPSLYGARRSRSQGAEPATWGFPTVHDRCIEHTLLQVLQEDWAPLLGEERRLSQHTRPGEQATRGGWISIWRSALTGSTTTC